MRLAAPPTVFAGEESRASVSKTVSTAGPGGHHRSETREHAVGNKGSGEASSDPRGDAGIKEAK